MKQSRRSSSMQWRVALGSSYILALLGSVALGAGEDEWTFSYEKSDPQGPQHWGDLHPEWALCKDGREQSPIAIHSTGKKGSSAGLTQLNTSYVAANGVLFHSGHALEIDVVDGNAGDLVLDGEVYLLTQFHFHSPSEHVVDGARFPLDMHMVHKTADGSKIAVVGLPFRDGPRSPFLDEFWDKLRELQGSEKLDIGPLLVDQPHLRVGPNYARYRGSLTTPPCTEGVIWTVCLEDWNTISKEQLEELQKLLPEPFARPLQKKHGRSVEFYKP